MKPNALGHGAPGGVKVAVGASESGITLHHGEHEGRLLMPGRIQPPGGTNAQEYWPYNYNTAIYSDDGGKTWQVSGPVQSGTGEGTLAELSSGDIYYNSRSHMSVDHRRRIAWSHNGGEMWVDWEVSDDLFEVGEPFYFKYGTRPSSPFRSGLADRRPRLATAGGGLMIDAPGRCDLRLSKRGNAELVLSKQKPGEV